MQINRRDFVKLLGGSLIGFAAGGVGEALLKVPNAVVPLLYGGPRVGTWKTTTCSRCPGKCGLRVRMVDGFPIQAFGNPLAPANFGGICPMGLTSVETLYHPDRLTSPMKKVDGRFHEISYVEAYRMLSDAIRNNAGGSAAFVAQTESEFMAGLIGKFMSGLDSPKVSIDEFTSVSASPYRAVADDLPDFIDFRRCDFIINFGSQFTEISESPSYFTRAINEFRAGGNEFVTLSPRLTPSAYKSNRWLPVLPAFYGDVALGMANVILADGTYDRNFVGSDFKGFDDFRKLVLAQYNPSDVESRTGVASKDIVETARKFANAAAPVAYFDESILHSSNGTRNAYAVIALNALKGFTGYGKLKDPELPGRGTDVRVHNPGSKWNPQRLLDDGEIKLLMVYRSNFVFNSPNPDELRKAISKIPMVVSFSPFIDETSGLADLIIPDHDDLEKLDAFTSTVTGTPVISIQQPVVKPFYSTVHTGDLLVKLVGDLKLSKNWEFSNYEDYLQASLKPVYKRGSGMLMNQKKPTGLEKSLHEAGWQMASYSSFDEFWDQMLRYGGWWDPFPKTSTFRPVLSMTVEQLTKEDGARAVNSKQDEGSLRLNIFLKNLDYKGNMLRNPVLTEQFGMERDVYYATWVEINPSTAGRLSVADRSRVKVRTAKGSFDAIAVYNPAVMPANIDVPFGLGHTASARTYGVNPLEYSGDVFDIETGLPSLSETVVEIG